MKGVKMSKEIHREILEEITKTYIEKNSDYGNSFEDSFDDFGIVSAVVRMFDKMNRIKSLTKPGVERKVQSEKIEDTLLDLANYAIMTVVKLRKDERKVK
jgi:hypothetical protein